MPFARANGVEIFYEVYQPFPNNNDSAALDPTPLLLIMGLGLNSLSWRKNLAGLVARHTVITFDNRGTGRSTKPDEPYKLREMARDAIAVLDALNIRRAHIYGFSLGSLIAQELALNYTHRVKSLILGATTAGNLRHVVSPPGVIETMVERGWVEPAQAADMVVPVIYSPDFIENHSDQVAADTATRLVYPTPPYAYRRQMMAAFYHDTYDRLDQLPMPVLLITGTEDLLIVPENSRLLARRIPRAELVELPGAGHYYTSEQPQASNQAVLEFLAGVGGRGKF